MKGYRIAIQRTVSTGVWASGGIPAGEECVMTWLLAPTDPDPSPYVQDYERTGVVQIVDLPGEFTGTEDALRSYMMWQARFSSRLPKLGDDLDRLVDEWGVGTKSADHIRAVLRAEREAADAQLARNRRRRKPRAESTHDRNKRWRSEARPCINKSEAARVIAEREGVEFEAVRKALAEKKPTSRPVLKR